jgi:ABC-type arginine transport system ATPase subunit
MVAMASICKTYLSNNSPKLPLHISNIQATLVTIIHQTIMATIVTIEEEDTTTTITTATITIIITDGTTTITGTITEMEVTEAMDIETTIGISKCKKSKG